MKEILVIIYFGVNLILFGYNLAAMTYEGATGKQFFWWSIIILIFGLPYLVVWDCLRALWQWFMATIQPKTLYLLLFTKRFNNLSHVQLKQLDGFKILGEKLSLKAQISNYYTSLIFKRNNYIPKDSQNKK